MSTEFPRHPWMDAIAADIRREEKQTQAPARKAAKLAALIAPGSGATEGERAAAQHALDRLNDR